MGSPVPLARYSDAGLHWLGSDDQGLKNTILVTHKTDMPTTRASNPSLAPLFRQLKKRGISPQSSTWPEQAAALIQRLDNQNKPKEALRQNHREMVAHFDKVITQFLNTGLSHFKIGSHMAKVYHDDATALRSVLTCFRRKKFVEAWAIARGLDTLVRDIIPENIWELLQQYE
jgi:hypothetical protein